MQGGSSVLSFLRPNHDSMLLLPHPHFQVPEWTKCSNREKRKEKEKPFYSDSEGESGPTESADSGEISRAGDSVPLPTCVFHMVSHVHEVVHLLLWTSSCGGGPEGLHVPYESICVLVDAGGIWGVRLPC